MEGVQDVMAGKVNWRVYGATSILLTTTVTLKWHIHTARERDRDEYRELNQYNRKQLVLVPFPVLDQSQHLCTIY